MFGYITPVKDELKVKDFELFKSYYCGLCMCIKSRYGNIPRFGLNYDITFFAILMDALNDESREIFNTTCIKHLKNKMHCITENKALKYASDLNISLIYYKLLDDIDDNNKLSSKCFLRVMSPYHNKKLSENMDKIIHDNLSRLRNLELSGNFSSLDEISHYFAHIIGEVLRECPFKFSKDSTVVRSNLYNFGYNFGKWIYLMDALDDLKDDMENDIFNPILAVYNKEALPYDLLVNNIKEDLDFTLMHLAVNCRDILKELPINKNKEILDNIINLGLLEKYMNISSKL